MVAALLAMGLLASGAFDEQLYSVFTGRVVTPVTLHFALIGAVTGYLVHLGLDCLTSAGIWLVWPGAKRVGLAKKSAVRSGGVVEHAIAACMLVACLGLAAILVSQTGVV